MPKAPVPKVPIIQKSTDEKQLIDASNTLESSFFSLSSAITTGKSKTLEQQDTDLEIDSDMIIKIVQCITGAALLVVLIVLLHRLRNRFNRIVHRIIPKTKFPPPHHPNGNQAQNQYHIANQPHSMPLQQTQLTPFSPSNGNSNFQNMHEMFKPQESGIKA